MLINCDLSATLTLYLSLSEGGGIKEPQPIDSITLFKSVKSRSC